MRPKSREETPKEGNETDELVAGLASCNLDVRRTKCKGFLLHCRSATGTWLCVGRRGQPRADPGSDIKKGPLEDERPKSREETPKVGYDTSGSDQTCR